MDEQASPCFASAFSIPCRKLERILPNLIIVRLAEGIAPLWTRNPCLVPYLPKIEYYGFDCTSRSRVTTTSSRGALVSISYPAARLSLGSTLSTKLSTRATSSGRFPY